MKPIRIEGKFLQCTGIAVDNYYQAMPYYAIETSIVVGMVTFCLGVLMTMIMVITSSKK